MELPDGSTTITMSNLGDIAFGTLEPGTAREEQISFTGITQNGDGTATLTGVTRGLRFVYPYDEVSANKKAHAGGAVFVLSNTAAFYGELSARDNDETVTGLYTFVQFPQKSGSTTPTAAAELATKAYVDSVVAGSAVYDQNIVVGVAGETLAAGDLVYFKTSDGRWWLTDADTSSTVDGVIIGFAQGTAAAAASVNILIGGIDKNQSGLTAGTTYYASNTAGDLSASAGTTERVVGKALTTTSIILDQEFAVLPTAAQKAALVGSNGTLSSTNKFVSQSGLQAQTGTYYASAVGTDSYAITPSPAIAAYATGMKFTFLADVANTGAATLAVSGLSALAIKKMNDQDIVTGDIEAGQIVEVVYDGTDWQMQSQTAVAPPSLNYQAFTASGTWTKPVGLTGDEIAVVHLWGAGGGGGGVDGQAAASDNGAGGGGGGAFVEFMMKVSALGSTETVTIGAGGTAGASGNNDGVAGGTTTFGSWVSAPGGGLGEGNDGPGGLGSGGGGGGGIAAGGGAGNANGTGGTGGGYGGGAASNGVPTTANGGGGGGATDNTSAGGAGYYGGGGGGGGSNTATASAGGASKYGGGGGGGGKAGAGGVSLLGGNGGAAGTNGAGVAGSAPGGGGGGGGSNDDTNYAGGAGARGEVRVWVIK